MISIKKAYKVKVVKYNFDEPFMSFKKEFDNFPNEEDVENTLVECDENYPQHKNFGTTLHIEEYYKVTRS